MPTLADITPVPKPLIGMIHLKALPGTPAASLPVAQIAAAAAAEARLLASLGFDALLIENMHDTPYMRRTVGPEIVAAMTACARSVRDAAPGLPLGVQVLAGANREALAVALASDAAFIRAENFVFAHVADEGLMDEADAGPLLRFRKAVGADHIAVFTDIKKKHAAHAITADIPIEEAAHAASFARADAVIATGPVTGRAVSLEDLALVRVATNLPVLVGSGATPESAEDLLQHADAIIVGSWIKQGGAWSNEIDPKRAEKMVEAVGRARG